MIPRSQGTGSARATLSFVFTAIAIAASVVGSAEANAANRAPRISGQPATSVKAASWYDFRPTAFDADGQRLTFSIRNKPSWATFAPATGRLSGAPPRTAAGRVHSGISIRVSDGRLSAALPSFAIRVLAPNRAPRISGTPLLRAVVGKPYSFKPSAWDADRDRLRYRVANAPGWANFDATTGTLWGTPRHVGRWSNVTISVTDGRITATLPRFTLQSVQGSTRSATLNWRAPTQNEDGTHLTDLAGYRIAYGTAPGRYSTRLEVPGAATTSAVVEGLGAGTWYFAVRAVTRNGELSDFSREVRKTFP